MFVAFAGHFMAKICKGVLKLKAPSDYSASLNLYIFDFIIGKPSNASFVMISGFLDVSRSPKTNINYLWDPRISQVIQEKSKNISKIICYKSHCQTSILWILLERRAPQIMKIRLIHS